MFNPHLLSSKNLVRREENFGGAPEEPRFRPASRDPNNFSTPNPFAFHNQEKDEYQRFFQDKPGD